MSRILIISEFKAAKSVMCSVGRNYFNNFKNL